MVARAHLRVVVRDVTGAIQAGETITFYESDGSTPFSGSLYAAVSGGSPVTSHTTDSLGVIERWTTGDNAKRVKVGVSGVLGSINASFDLDPEDIVRQGGNVPVIFDGYASTDWAQTVKNGQAVGSASPIARFLDSNDLAILRIWRASGGNPAVSINLLNDTIPTTNAFEVRKASGASYQLADVELQATAGGIIQTAIRGTNTQTVSGISNVAGVTGIATRTASASAGGVAQGLRGEMGTTVAGTTPLYNAAVAAISKIVTSGIQDGAAFAAGGPGAGFDYLLWGEDASAVNYAYIDVAGQMVANVGATGGLSFIGDLDTMVYRSAANQLSLRAGGVDYLTVVHGSTKILAREIDPETTSTYTLGSSGRAWLVVVSDFINVSTSGAANAPSLTFLNDSNTGFFNQAADVLGITTGGTEKLRIGTLLDFRDAGMAIALGGGSSATLGTIGASGPATAGQNSWLKVAIGGTNSFIPVWR